jgi:hypothetical protein
LNAALRSSPIRRLLAVAAVVAGFAAATAPARADDTTVGGYTVNTSTPTGSSTDTWGTGSSTDTWGTGSSTDTGGTGSSTDTWGTGSSGT